MENYEYISVKNKDENKELVRISIFLWVAALVSMFIPIASIPFAIIAVCKAFSSNSKLSKVASIVVLVFIGIVLIYWFKSVFDIMIEEYSSLA